MHDAPLITTIALGLAAALGFGLLAHRLGLSPLLGYLLAGIAVGPHTPGFVGDLTLSTQLAEMGVILLMFGVGLHFRWSDLLAVRSIAIPGALGQSLVATLATMALVRFVGFDWAEGAVLGIAISVASTVVLLRVLMDHQHVETTAGHVSVGWLIVEDVITVLVLVILPAFAVDGEPGSATEVLLLAGTAVAKLIGLGLLVAVVGRRFVPWLLFRVARLRSPELFTLAILVMSISVAAAVYLAFGASMALGAFLAGMLVGQSKFSHQAAAEMLPLRDAFAVLFFVSVGMLFDYRAVLGAPWLAFIVVVVILLVKPLVAFSIVLLLGHTPRTALTVAGGLSQIGEFSFILADVATSNGLLPPAARAALVFGAMVSICLNPFLYRGLLRLEPALSAGPFGRAWFSRHATDGASVKRAASEAPKATPAIVVGYGPVGRSVSDLLHEAGVANLVIEMNIDSVSELHDRGRAALYGDASRRDILEQAHVSEARFLVVTVPDPGVQLSVIATAREMHPELAILTRARFRGDRHVLRQAGADVVCSDEAGASFELAQALLERVQISTESIERTMRHLRKGSRAHDQLETHEEA